MARNQVSKEKLDEIKIIAKGNWYIEEYLKISHVERRNARKGKGYKHYYDN